MCIRDRAEKQPEQPFRPGLRTFGKNLQIMRFLLSLFLLLASSRVFSNTLTADSTDKVPAVKLFRSIKFIALPVVFKLPETGWGGGVAGSTTFSFARDSSFAKPSQVSFGATYTQKKQVLLFVPCLLYTSRCV